ncbi:MAG TPA: AAA family ATPase [Solirubrobacteraceae bacterium]|nr:AAA family ATPase [Solirubrobacteraceae bacterium]
MSQSANTRVQLCGEIIVQIDGRRLERGLGGRQSRMLLAYLVLHRTRAIRRDELIEALWPANAPADPAGGLNTLVSRLRRALGAGVLHGRSELRLCLPAGADVDVETAASAVSRAEIALERFDWDIASRAARGALEIVQAGFLPGSEAPWIDEERGRIEELLLRSQECIAAAGLGLGGSQLSMTERAARALIDRAPFRETGHGFLMRALAERGRIAEAVQVFDAFRIHVRQELGIPPGASLRALHERLLTRQETAPHSERDDALAVGSPPGAHLLTDIAGSDAQQRGQHARLVRSAVAVHGGRGDGSSGKESIAVFRSAANAASCAVALQQAAARHNDRHPEHPIHLRVALDVGQGGVDVGGAATSVARALCGRARPGQILAATSLPAAVADAGEHRFRAGQSSVELLWEPAAEEPIALPKPLAGGDRGAFVGRESDLEHVERAYLRATLSGPRLTLIFGEPGIGKTRLATELAVRAHADGAVVLYGRCNEEPLLAHQPFVEALRHYVSVAPAAELAGQMRPISAELLRVLPELAERVSELSAPLAVDPDGARYRLFEAMSSLLCDAAQLRPVVLVLDDLHWADPPTLLLLKYLMRYPRDASLLVLCTYRHTELGPDHPLAGVLADLAREQPMERHELARLDLDAVAELVAAHTAGGGARDLAAAVHDATAGNPFFVVEMLRNLSDADLDSETAVGPAIRQGVSDVIGRRLARLGRRSERVLSIAAVAGPAFEFGVLERVSGLGEDDLLDTLDEAARAHVVEETGGGRYAFAHALIRETLYAGLGATRRALLHRRVATALEEAHAADLSEYRADLAHHFLRAGTDADLGKAVTYATGAGERASSLLAFEQAAAHFRQAATLIEEVELPRRIAQRCALLISQGEAERQAADPAYRQTLLQAAAIARELDDAELLCRAALANTRGSIFSSAQGVDRDRVSGLEHALRAHGPHDSPIRARLLAHLAMELLAGPEWMRREQLADEALDIARRLGDPASLARVLTMRCNTTLGPRVTRQRREHTAQAARLADELGDPIVAAEAAIIGAGAALEAGDVADAGRLHERYAELTAQLGIPYMRWYERSWRVKHCLIVGAPQAAERLAFETLAIGQEVGQPDAFAWCLSQIGVARLLQGTLDEGEPNLPDLFALPVSLPIGPELTPSHSVWLQVELGKSSTFCEVGRLEEGRRHYEAAMVHNLEDLPRDYAELWIPMSASAACVQLGDRERAPRLHALIEPYADRFVDNGPAWAGAAAHYLGRLARLLEDYDEADERFDAAARSYERIGAPAWLVHARIDWAEMLRTRRRAGDLERAATLLSHAAGAARELGLDRIERRIAGLTQS